MVQHSAAPRARLSNKLQRRSRVRDVGAPPTRPSPAAVADRAHQNRCLDTSGAAFTRVRVTPSHAAARSVGAAILGHAELFGAALSPDTSLRA